MNAESVVPAVIDRALRAAVRAPSPHNTQPWRFEVGPGRIHLLLDRDRILAVADPDGREARLACGAALFNLLLSLHAAGHATRPDLLPDRDRPDLVATVRIGGHRPASPELQALASVIEHRASHRRPFTAEAVPSRLRLALMRAAALEGGRLIPLDAPRDLSTFAALLRRADHLQTEDPSFQQELRRWTANHPGRTDGVPPAAGGPRPSVGDLLTPRDYTGHSTVDAALIRPYEQDPLVVVLATPGDTAQDHLRAGQALQRVLLTATAGGLRASFLSQPVEIAPIRSALRDLIGGRNHPQTVLRIGYGYTTPQSARRPAHTVTTTAQHQERTNR